MASPESLVFTCPSPDGTCTGTPGSNHGSPNSGGPKTQSSPAERIEPVGVPGSPRSGTRTDLALPIPEEAQGNRSMIGRPRYIRESEVFNPGQAGSTSQDRTDPPGSGTVALNRQARGSPLEGALAGGLTTSPPGADSVRPRALHDWLPDDTGTREEELDIRIDRLEHRWQRQIHLLEQSLPPPPNPAASFLPPPVGTSGLIPLPPVKEGQMTCWLDPRHKVPPQEFYFHMVGCYYHLQHNPFTEYAHRQMSVYQCPYNKFHFLYPGRYFFHLRTCPSRPPV